MKSLLPTEREVKDLVFHANSENFYGRRDDDFDELVKSISRFGVLQPIIICGNQVQVGNRRLRAAIEIGLTTIPAFDVENEFDMAQVVASQLHRQKLPSIIIKELAYLDDTYGVRQGARTDLRREVFAEVKKWKEQIAGSNGNITRLRRVKRLADVVFENNPKGWEEFLNKMDKGEISIHRALITLNTKLEAMVKEKHQHLITVPQSEFNIYNKDAFGFDEVQDSSVQCIVTSPPYYRMRDYGTGKKQLGQERTPMKFAKRLADFFNEAKRVLKPDGSMFVVIGDKVEDGQYSFSPQLFAFRMKLNGWKLNDEIIWTKLNTQPNSSNRTNRSHEYIFHFVLNDDFKYFPRALNGNQKYQGRMSNSTIITPNSNPAQKERICDSYGVPFTHSATFPEFIPAALIQLTTEENDLVLDPFTGTGTTGVVANELGRNFVGYELNPEYYQVASTLMTHFKGISTQPRIDVDVIPQVESQSRLKVSEATLDDFFQDL